MQRGCPKITTQGPIARREFAAPARRADGVYRSAFAIAAATALALAGCSTASPLPSLAAPGGEIAPANVASPAPAAPQTLAAPAANTAAAETATSPIPVALAIPDIAAALAPGKEVVGTPTEVYTRVARGVLTCWFAASGPLKQTHIYHAEAAPASKGGKAEIEIFIKDTTASDPRGLRAYRIDIAPTETRPKVTIENIKVPEPLAERFAKDVERWAADEAGCGDEPVTAGWSAAPDLEADKAGKGKGTAGKTAAGTPAKASTPAVVPATSP